jgi:hypothetical protein
MNLAETVKSLNEVNEVQAKQIVKFENELRLSKEDSAQIKVYFCTLFMFLKTFFII